MEPTTREAGARIEELVETAVRRTMKPFCDELRAFVDRRLAEVSAEINAAVQIVDFSEAALSGQLAGIQDQVSRVLTAPDDAARNSGLELATIVGATEEAAHRILDAAEEINRAITANGSCDADLLREKLAEIFNACEFQDLAGQRIRRTIAHLQLVEGTIAVLASNGARAPMPDLAPESPPSPELAQGEVDKLFQ
jgi:chemotaxis protein CheZ